MRENCENYTFCVKNTWKVESVIYIMYRHADLTFSKRSRGENVGHKILVIKVTELVRAINIFYLELQINNTVE